MAGLKYTMGAMEPGGTRRTYGTAYWDGSRWFARIQDSLLEARWLDTIETVQGGPIVIDITNDGHGQSSALVLGAYADQPRPSFVVQPVAAAPPAPPTVSTGSTLLVATASDTWSVNGWGRWATSQFGGEDVYTGTQSGYTVTGSWFYGAPKPELAGKTATRVQFKVPGRMNVGASGPATIHLYAHTSGARPGGDVSRIVGPFDVVVQQGSAGGLIDLPLTFAPAIVAGGGISIAGGPYAGFNSRLDDPESGKLILDWSS